MCAAHSVRLNFSAPRYTECGIRVGDRVLIGGLYPGSVKYVGNLDVPHPNAEVYVGARLDDPGEDYCFNSSIIHNCKYL